jgi:hypothetical protein
MHNVLMAFDKTIPVEHHGPLMLAFEREARKVTGLRVEVFKHARGDDSKLRAAMTPEQRAKL